MSTNSRPGMFELVKQHVTSVVFPSFCLHCEVALEASADHQWCGACLREMRGSEAYSCLRCSAHLKQPSPFASGCAVCRNTQVRFDSAVSVGNYRGHLQVLIREMKRTKSEPAANQLGRALAQIMLEQAIGCEAHVVVPMPIHWWKRLRRGFNASARIADGVASTLRLPQRLRVLRSTRLTQKQGTLSTIARIRNVRGAIQVIRPKSIVGKHVVLVDDVSTSCATANEASQALKDAGAKEVTLAVVARGVRAS